MELSIEQIDSLRNELSSDPAQLGFHNYLPSSPGQAVALLNDKRFVRNGAVQKSAFMVWAVKWGERSNIEDHSDPTMGSPVRDIALAMQDILRGSLEELNLGDPEVYELVSFWQFRNPAALPDLVARAQVPASRMEILFGAGNICTEDNIHQAGF